MKKSIIIMLGLALMSVQSFADTRAQALLLHNGQGKSFDADQLQQAVNEAVDGDTICLSEGTFKVGGEGTLLINKDIALMGAGGDITIIGGNINIDLEENPTVHRHVLDAIRIKGNVTVGKSIRGVHIRNCWISETFNVQDETEVYDIQIDRCYLNSFFPSLSMMSATVTNSIISAVGKSGGGVAAPHDNIFIAGHDINFMNCSIYELDLYCKLAANYTNSIIHMSLGGQQPHNNTLTNTLLTSGTSYPTANHITKDGGNVLQNCYSFNYKANIALNNDHFPTFSLTKETMLQEGFLGTDGTIVGAYGGATPYTLQADGLSIKESVLRVDPDTRQLNVTLKVEKQ